MKKSIEQRRYESGRSMVEMVGVLAITGLITAGAFILIRAGLASQKRSRTADEVATLVAGARALSADSETFANLPAKPRTYAITDGSATLAGALLGSTAAVVTPLDSGSYYSVHRATSNTQFNVVLVNIPLTDCTTLASRAWAESVGSAVCASSAAPYTLTITYGKD